MLLLLLPLLMLLKFIEADTLLLTTKLYCD